LIIGLVWFIYRPIYTVTLNGEVIGYSKDKSELQKKINSYIAYGEGQNVAFVEIDNLPEYEICFQKKDIITTDEEIFDIVKTTGTVFYEYYAMLKEGQETLYLSTYEEAERTIEELKLKPDYDKQNVGFVQKYGTSLAEFSTVEVAVEKLYTKQLQPVVVAKTTKKSSTGVANVSRSTNTGEKVNISVGLIKPISGTITSRFGGRRSGMHTGLDIAASTGTKIKAAADGTVTFSGWKGSYGNMVIVSHGDGVQTYYAHCNSLNVEAGEKVTQGSIIGTVGSTGNSTGSHLHLEVRVNGVAQNPQNYVY